MNHQQTQDGHLDEHFSVSVRVRRKRRYYTLFVIVFLLVGVAGWRVVKIGNIRRESQAIKALREFGNCEIAYSSGDADTPIPNWMRNRFGDDFLSYVVIVDIWKSRLTDDGMRHFGDLPNLRQLKLTGTSITDTGLKHIEGLTSLENLDLGDNNITDKGTKYIKALSRLKTLSLRDTKLTDAGLINIKELDKLEYLDIQSTNVTDRGLEMLTTLKTLKKLNVVNTAVTSQGLDALRRASSDLKIVH